MVRHVIAALALVLLSAPAVAEFGPPQILGAGLAGPDGEPAQIEDIALDPVSGDILLVSGTWNRALRMSLADGLDGLGPDAPTVKEGALSSPEGLAVAADGTVYLADTGNGRAVRMRLVPGGSELEIDPAFSPMLAPGLAAIDRPRDIEVGPDGTVYLLDSGNARILATGPDGGGDWRIAYQGDGWSEAQGFGLTSDGGFIVADTGHHRVLRVAPDGTETAFGRFGRDAGGLRYPHDVGELSDGRMAILDTHNARIVLLGPDGSFLRTLGRAPTLRNPTGLAIGPEDTLLVADTERSHPVAWLGAEVPRRFDGVIRDRPDDDGSEPGSLDRPELSPDIVVRLAPDLDIAALGPSGLDGVASEPVTAGQSAFIYVQIANRGVAPLPASSVRILTAERATMRGASLGPLPFPEDWRDDETRALNPDGSPGDPAFRLPVPEIPPGHVVVGPLVWEPSRDIEGCDGEIVIMARLVQPDDPIETGAEGGRAQAAESNNVALRRVPLVEAGCLPSRDRFEVNDTLAQATRIDGGWSLLKDRCPRRPAVAGAPYPEALCEGIFENGIAPRFAEQIFTLDLGDLTFHSGGDIDIYDIALPRMSDPAYGLDDITPSEVRLRYGDAPTYEPEPMPECGSVQRTDPGPGGAADRRVWVNVATRLMVEIRPEGAPGNDLARDPIGIDDERLIVQYPAGRIPEREIFRYSDGAWSFDIECPGGREGLDAITLIFGDRTDPPGDRNLDALGGYRMTLHYIASITRTTPAWATDPGITGEARGLGCLGLMPVGSGGPGPLPGGFGLGQGLSVLPDFRFPFCPEDLGIIPGLVAVPDLPCIADGPGCWFDSFFYWPDVGIDFEFLLLGPPGPVSLVDAAGRTVLQGRISEDLPIAQFPQIPVEIADTFKDASVGLLFGQGPLEEGLYAIRFSGTPGLHAILSQPGFPPVSQD